MPRLRPLALFVVGVTLSLFALLYALELANREAVKARLEALLSERTDLTTQINGKVRWRYFWPTAITVTDVSARNEQGSEQWRLDSLRLEISTGSVLGAPSDPDKWQVIGFRLKQLTGERSTFESATSPPDQIAVSEFSITGLRPEQTAPFAATVTYQPGGREAAALSLAGQLRFVAEERRLHFEPALVSGDVATGECRADIALRPIVESTQPARGLDATALETSVLNTDLWRRSDWDLECQLSEVRLLGASFSQVSLSSNNFLGKSASKLELPDFFGGSAELALGIDATDQTAASPPSLTWTLTPLANNVGSRELISWLEGPAAKPPPWHGPVNITGAIETEGNTRPAMIEGARGELQLLSTNGQVDLSEFKRNVQEPLEKLGPLIGDAEDFSRWPDVLDYEVLKARWQPTAGEQQLRARIDNLRLKAVATIDADLRHSAKDQLTANGTLTFTTDVEPIAFPVPRLMQDLPLPFGCEGTPVQPECRLDAAASKELLVDALQGRGSGGLTEKIDELIEEKVPEQYQKAARSLLEILGHSIDDDEADELEDFLGDDPDELIDEAAEGG